MSVNKFGGSTNTMLTNSTSKYVDSKTLTANLSGKVNKTGDSLSGDLNILLTDDSLRTFGVPDITGDKSVSLLLGDINNQIRHNHGHAVKHASTHGFSFTCPSGEICKFGSNKSRFFTEINMNNNNITDVKTPTDDKDAVNKEYLLSRHSKNSVGLIPMLYANNDKTGFQVSASSEPNFFAYNIFNSYSTNAWSPTTGINYFVKVKCPNPVIVYRFQLRGKTLAKASYRLELHGSTNDYNWILLFKDENALLNDQISTFDCTYLNLYSIFKIIVLSSDATVHGFTYCQLFTMDPIV